MYYINIWSDILYRRPCFFAHLSYCTVTHQMSNRFIYIQNCLQQDFWINIDPQGDNGVQVHNTTCTMESSQQKEKKINPLRAPWVMKGSRWGSLKDCKAQDTASPASLQPSSIAHQSTTYSAKHLIRSYNYPLQVQHEGYGDTQHCVMSL